MADAHQLRQAIERSALDASAAHPQDPDARVQTFVCKLFGAMFTLGELQLEDLLWQRVLMSGGAQPTAQAPALAAQG